MTSCSRPGTDLNYCLGQVTSCRPGTDTPRRCSACSDTLPAVQLELGKSKYVRQPCTLFSDASIGTCAAAQKCPVQGEYWSACTNSRDGMCIPCTNTVCEMGKFLSPCQIASDTECVSCNASVQCPIPETYRSECRYSEDHVCKNCTKCMQGVTFETQACTNVTNRECVPCTFLGACPPNTYKKSGCTVKRNTECYPCSKHACPDGFYESEACNATTDRICSKCSSKCPLGHFVSGACRPDLDLQCTPCSSPVCATGSYRTACTVANDSVCTKCSYNEEAGCPPGTFENQSCTPLTNRQCRTCQACSGNNYQEKACHGTEDTKCGFCVSSSQSLYTAWSNGQDQVNSMYYCKPYSEFASGTCNDEYYESASCSSPPLQYVDTIARRLCGVNLLYHPNLQHNCSRCRSPCNPYRRVFLFFCIQQKA